MHHPALRTTPERERMRKKDEAGSTGMHATSSRNSRATNHASRTPPGAGRRRLLQAALRLAFAALPSHYCTVLLLSAGWEGGGGVPWRGMGACTWMKILLALSFSFSSPTNETHDDGRLGNWVRYVGFWTLTMGRRSACVCESNHAGESVDHMTRTSCAGLGTGATVASIPRLMSQQQKQQLGGLVYGGVGRAPCMWRMHAGVGP